MNSPVSAPLDEIPDSRGFSLCGVSQNGTHRLKPVLLQPQKSNDVTTSVSYHLRKISEMPQKSPNVFYHLQTASPVTTCVSYHLRKKAGGGGGDSTFNLELSTLDRAPSRPCVSPLFSILSSNAHENAPLSNSFRFNQFQTSRKAPLPKSFRMIAFRKKGRGGGPPLATSHLRLLSHRRRA
jgi:hypothetical protein